MNDSPAVTIKKFCSTPERPVSMMEMKHFMAACKDDDVRDNLPAGTTLSRFANQVPSNYLVNTVSAG